MRRRGFVALGALVTALAGCTTLTNDTQWTVLEPSRTTLQAGSEQRFRIDWTVDPGPDASPRIEGYVYNLTSYPVERARVLVDAFDPSGAVVGQRLFWLVGTLPTGGSLYFDLPAPAADRYQVTLWDFNVAPRGP